ncbi:unnamed protein product [Pylaiella littoralis]
MTGTAGTGKTDAMREMVRRIGRHRFLLLVPTGNAACAIGGQIRSRVPLFRADPSDLSSPSQDLQRRLREVEFILVDEHSMAALGVLGLMSIRYKQAVEGRPGSHARQQGLFGGMNVILVGDPMQLPPVGAAPVWNPTTASDGHTMEDYHAWTHLNAAVELTEMRRQEGDDQGSFRQVLSHAAEGCVVQADWYVLLGTMRIAGGLWRRRTPLTTPSTCSPPTPRQTIGTGSGQSFSAPRSRASTPGTHYLGKTPFRQTVLGVWRPTSSSLLVPESSSTTTFGRRPASLTELSPKCSTCTGRLIERLRCSPTLSSFKRRTTAATSTSNTWR